MADTKISALTAASALDGTEVAPVVQSGTTKKATVDQYKTYINNGTALVDIQTNVNAAQALLASSGSAITAGQGYILDNGGVTQLPTGISLMRLVGINLPAGAKGFGYAEAYITALDTYVPCTYDVATNKIQIQLTNKMFVSVDGLGSITIDSVVNNEWNGITFSASNVSGGTYLLVPSQTLKTIFTAVSMHCEQVIPQGADAVGFASSVDDYAHDEYYYYIYDTTFSGSSSVAFPHNLITFIGYIYN